MFEEEKTEVLGKGLMMNLNVQMCGRAERSRGKREIGKICRLSKEPERESSRS